MTEPLLPRTPAHQFPLLRRPKPPPPRSERAAESQYSRCRGAHANARLSELGGSSGETAGPGLQERLRAISTPVHPLPRHHPTPTSPHRHTHKSPTRYFDHSPSPIHETDCDHPLSGGDETTGSGGEIPLPPVRGPPPFPLRKRKVCRRRQRCSYKQKSSRKEQVSDCKQQVPPEPEEDEEEFPPMFSDLDEAEEIALYEPRQTRLRERVISRQNYLKLTGWFATHVPLQDTLNTKILIVDHSVPEFRKPHHQILLELEAMVDATLPEPGGAGKETTGGVTEGEQELMDSQRWPTPTPGDIVFRSSTSRYFFGEGRSNSPFDGGGQPLISPSEVVILESMLEGGYRLSLKAHFLDSLPPLSLLSLTLTRLNLSFNTLTVFPIELLELTQLKLLRMRNNPIQHLPDDIKRLGKLEDFCISFNCLTSLPSGLYELPLLQTLDVSHNSIHHLSRDVSKLTTLRRLNVESNELIGLPPSLLSLPLTHLHVSGNYLHPLLWRENCRSQPQTLVDVCCTVVSAATGVPELPFVAMDILRRRKSPNVLCDCCGGPIFGPGLRVVRFVARSAENSSFPLKSVPVLFITCSQTCRKC